MEIITAEECQRRLGKEFYDRWDNGDWRKFATGFVRSSDSGKLNSLAREVGASLSETDGSILLVEQIGIFQSSENMYLAQMFRKAFGEMRSIREAPAYVFASEDSLVFWSTMHICLLNFWDFLVVSADRNVCIHSSHDEVLEIFALGRLAFEKIRRVILPFEFKEISVGTPA
jgi:hypothetical protein